MNKSKEKSQNSHSKPKKKIRETNSYKIQFKTKIKQKSNLNSKDKDKSKNKKNKYSQSNISAKTFNQKPTSSIIKEYNSQTNIYNNNAISYSNYAFSEMGQSKKVDNNILCESLKYNNDDYNTLLCSNNNKMEINDLGNANNNKFCKKNKNNRKKVDKDNDFGKNIFSKKAAKSMVNENEKMYDNYIYNSVNNCKKNNYETSLKRLDNKLNKEIDIKSFKKINLEIIEKDIKNKNEFEKFNTGSKEMIINDEITNNNYYEQNNNNILLNENNKKSNNNIDRQSINKINKGNNSLNNNDCYLANKNIMPISNDFNEQNNMNGQEINQNNIYDKNIQNLELGNTGCEANIELFNELEEKLQKLYFKIHKNVKEPQPEIPISINNSHRNEKQLTYPNLKRYREKSESSLRISKFDADINNYNYKNDNLTINSNAFRRKKSETNIRNIKVIAPQLNLKYKNDENNNKNLPKFQMLVNDLKTENSAKRMINILLNEQNNPELKNILFGLQMTIKKLPQNENSKEDSRISTLPANYLSPFEIFKFEKNKSMKNFCKLDVNKNISEVNRNRKIEKLKSKFNDFQEIMNKKPKNKNKFNLEQKNNKGMNYLINKKISKEFTNLYPANNPEDGLFLIDN